MTTDLEPRLRAWLATRVPAEVPVALVERVVGIPDAHPSRLARLRASAQETPLWRPRPTFTAGRLLATVAIAVLGMSAVLIVTSPGPTNVPAVSPFAGPSPVASQVLPSVIPADVPSGTIETSIGPARWVHLSGDPTTLPGPLTPIPGPTGLLWFDEGWGDTRCGETGEWGCPAAPALWWSAHAISERVELPLPVDAEEATLTALDGTWWLATTGPTTLWRTTDAERWERIDLGSVVSPGPAELDWEVRLGLPATSNGTTVVPVTYVALDSGRLLGRPDLLWPSPELSDGGYRIKDGYGEDVGEVRVEETESGLRFSDIEGNTLATLDGVGMEFVDAWSESLAIVEHQVALVDGPAAIPATLPGARLSGELGWRGPTLFGTSAGFHAYSPTPDGTTRTWRSDDGRKWIELDPLGDADGEPQGADAIERRPGPAWGLGWVTPHSVIAQDHQTGEVWESVDGESWASPVSRAGAIALRVGDGWVSFSPEHGWYESRDGTTWEQATGLNMVLTKRFSGGPRAIIGDALFFEANEGEGGTRQRDLWIVEFSGAPE